MKYYQVRTIKELEGIYYVEAESQEKAEELAWEKFGEELYQLRLEHCWEYDTITEAAERDDHDEWLVENEDGDVVYVIDGEDK